MHCTIKSALSEGANANLADTFGQAMRDKFENKCECNCWAHANEGLQQFFCFTKKKIKKHARHGA
jgi:hypothetical protein